jgi:flagellar protein FlbD
MITLTRLNGPPFALNCDLIERVEETPDTVIILIDGRRLLVAEDVATVIDRVRIYRASVIALAQSVEAAAARVATPESGLRLVSIEDKG